MLTQRYNPTGLLLLFSVLLVAGCAHKAARTPLTTTTPADSDRVETHKDGRIEAVSDQSLRPPAGEAAHDLDTDDLDEDAEFDMLDDELEENPLVVYDPLAPFNRVMFQLTDTLYYWALKPAAWTYRAVIPRDIRLCVRNFFNNIKAPIRLANCLFQGKLAAAGAELQRFFINTTAGILGFGDPAAAVMKTSLGDEDLGQTLAAYGVGGGPYIFLPILGPYTLRDAVGYAGDLFLSPFSYLDSLEASLGIFGFRMVNDTSFRIGEYESLKEDSLDPYVAIRDIYLQHRKKKIEE